MALFLTWLLLFLSVPQVFAHIERRAESQWPLHDDGLNKVVQWDHYSFQLNGERIFLFSGEFHYWRIPYLNYGSISSRRSKLQASPRSLLT